MRPDTIKIWENNTGRYFFDSHRNFFLDRSPEARETKAEINYWDFIKIKISSTAKETINKTKRQPPEWEKIFANDIADKGLISKIYKELTQFNTKNQIIESKNGWKTWIDIFPEKTYRWPTNNEKMLNITDQRNANQNHNEALPHTCQNGWNQRHEKQQMLGWGCG